MRTRFSTLKEKKIPVINSKGVSSPTNYWNTFSVAATKKDYEDKEFYDKIEERYAKAREKTLSRRK